MQVNACHKDMGHIWDYWWDWSGGQCTRSWYDIRTQEAEKLYTGVCCLWSGEFWEASNKARLPRAFGQSHHQRWPVIFLRREARHEKALHLCIATWICNCISSNCALRFGLVVWTAEHKNQLINAGTSPLLAVSSVVTNILNWFSQICQKSQSQVICGQARTQFMHLQVQLCSGLTTNGICRSMF